MPAGLAWGHRGNPAVALQVHQLYAEPVLLSGMCSLLLKKSEITLIDQHLKKTYQQLQKLMDKTPACVVYFLGGTLPGTAKLHLKLMSLFGMITRSPGSVLHSHALEIFTSAKSSSNSWFQQVREVFALYQLPCPHRLLLFPPTSLSYKKLFKSKVIDFWEARLRYTA